MTVPLIAGVDVAANQSADIADIGDTEIFQMEYSKDHGKWAFRDKNNRYWNLQSPPIGTVQSSKQET